MARKTKKTKKTLPRKPAAKRKPVVKRKAKAVKPSRRAAKPKKKATKKKLASRLEQIENAFLVSVADLDNVALGLGLLAAPLAGKKSRKKSRR